MSLAEAPCPAPPDMPTAPPDKPLSEYSVAETAWFLLEHLHVDPEVVERGFAKVDGKTLSSYDEKDLENAGVTNRPLRKRLLQEVNGKKHPLVAFVQRFSSSSRVDVAPTRRRSVGEVDEATVPHVVSPKSATPPLVKRQSTEWFRRVGLRGTLGSSRGSLGSSENLFRGSARPSRRDARLDGELKRYREQLPPGIVAIAPDVPSEKDDDATVWTVKVVDKTGATPDMRVTIPPQYPFAGPTIAYRGYEVQFDMGKNAQEFHDADSHVLHVAWTPAQRAADAVLSAVDVVRRAELEDQQHLQPVYDASYVPSRRPSVQLQQQQRRLSQQQQTPASAFT